jgi:hypothetical protein
LGDCATRSSKDTRASCTPSRSIDAGVHEHRCQYLNPRARGRQDGGVLGCGSNARSSAGSSRLSTIDVNIADRTSASGRIGACARAASTSRALRVGYATAARAGASNASAAATSSSCAAQPTIPRPSDHCHSDNKMAVFCPTGQHRACSPCWCTRAKQLRSRWYCSCKASAAPTGAAAGRPRTGVAVPLPRGAAPSARLATSGSALNRIVYHVWRAAWADPTPPPPPSRAVREPGPRWCV